MLEDTWTLWWLIKMSTLHSIVVKKFQTSKKYSFNLAWATLFNEQCSRLLIRCRALSSKFHRFIAKHILSCEFPYFVSFIALFLRQKDEPVIRTVRNTPIIYSFGWNVPFCLFSLSFACHFLYHDFGKRQTTHQFYLRSAITLSQNE